MTVTVSLPIFLNVNSIVYGYDLSNGLDILSEYRNPL